MSIDDYLPPGLSLDYLRQLAAVPEWWTIDVHFGDTNAGNAASLCVDAPARKARIILNACFVFTRAALARTLAHELMELSTIHSWLVFLRLTSMSVYGQTLIDDYRKARDAEISDRLGRLPWFRDHDVAIPREVVQGQRSDALVYHV